MIKLLHFTNIKEHQITKMLLFRLLTWKRIADQKQAQ